MKKNSFSFKKPKQSLIAFMMVFFCCIANQAFAQGTFTWNGATSSSWTTATNWTKSGTATTSTYPGQSSSTDLVVVNSTNSPNPVILTTGNTFTVARVTVGNNFGLASGAILTIDSGATLNIVSTTVTSLVLNGGNVVNNGAINITTSALGSSGFPVYGIACGNPANLPTVATEYGISGSGTLNITLSAANLATSAAIVTTGTTSVLPTYKIAMNGTISLNQGSTATINAVRTTSGATANKLILAGTGFTVGSEGSPSIGSLINLGAGTNVTVDSGTTLTFYSANTYTTSVLTGFSSSTTATNFTNNGTINILGASLRSGMGFSTGSSSAASVFNISNTGTLNVNLSAGTTGNSAFNIGNGGGGTVNAGSAVNFTNSGTATFKNTSTAVGSGNAIYCTAAGEGAPLTITNSGTMNLEGTTYIYAPKTTINNTGTINSNSEFRNLTAMNNNVGGSINFVKTAATNTTRQVVFNGLQTTDVSGAIGNVYSDGTNSYTVVVQKFGSGTSLATNVLSGATIPESGTLTLTSGSGGTTPLTFTSVIVPSLNNALPLVTSNNITNSGTINTDTASNLSIISAVTAASTGTIAPGGASGKGIADFSNASTLAISSTLKLDVSGGTTAGVDFDQITNSAAGGGFDLTGATLDVTGIYAPTGGYTVIDVITTNATGTLTGTFASVVGLGSGWSVVYNPGTGGTVQLVNGTAPAPTITKLSSNGTNTITSACEGSTLVIIGTNLTGVSEITVNGVALTNVTDVSSTRVEGILPIGARVGTVTITGPGGSATTVGNLTVVENSTNVTAITACDSYTWANNGQTYTTSGTYTGTTTGCVTQQLVLNIVTSPPPIVSTVTECGSSYVWPSNGVTYTQSGTYNIVVGCTAETLNLTLTPNTTEGSVTTSICSGASYTWPANGQTYTTAQNGTTFVSGCNTATLNLTITEPTTEGSVTTSICSGASYTWPANGQTYTTAQNGITFVSGCNTATLNLTITGPTTTGSETISQCGGSYTWPVNNVTYSASTTEVVTEGCNTATLNLTITPATTTGSETISQCGGSYTWPVNNVTYTVSTTEVVSVGCNTATLNLTITPATTTGSVTTSINAGESYTWPANGQTYTTAQNGTTFVSGCNTATLNLTVITTQIPASPYAVCTGATVATATAGTTLKFYKDTKSTTAAYAGTQKLAAATYYVTEMVSGTESARVPVSVTLTALVAPTTIASTEAKVICKYMGTSNLVTFTTTPVAEASSYSWSVPAGATIEGNATGDSITVSFEAVSGTPGLIGSVTVDSRNSLGCLSGKAKILALTTKAPTAPKTVVLTNGATVIKKAGNFVGDATKELTLTATDISGTADHHVWTLPAGTTVVTGDANNDLVLTVHLGNVTASNDALVFSCASVGGCGSSSKSLSIARAAAGTPKAITLTDALSATPTVGIKKLDAYTGSLKTRTLTLTATPNVTAGSEATSYTWVLPAAATVVDGTATAVEGQENTYTSTSASISVNLASVATETSFVFKVYGVNGNGTSLLSKDLTCTSAAPKAPAAIFSGGTGSGTAFAYNPSCGTVTISVPAVLGVVNDFISVSGGAILTNVSGNTATIDLSATSAVAKSTITIRAIASTATGSSSKDFVIKLGTPCGAGKMISEELVAEDFTVIAYPNPSASEFTIESSSKGATTVQVYDMMGRLIENAQANANSVQVGRNYAAGTYNVIVSQGAKAKTLKVIKK